MVESMSWNDAGEKAEELTQGVIIKLKDKQEIEGIFIGDPVMDRKHFVNGKPQICIGEGCVLCANEQPLNTRWYINFLAKGNTGYTMRVMGLSSTIFNRLNVMRTKIKTRFDRTLFSIQREGVGTDTDYILTPQGLAPDIEGFVDLPENNIISVLKGSSKGKNKDEDDNFPFK